MAESCGAFGGFGMLESSSLAFAYSCVSAADPCNYFILGLYHDDL